MRSLFKDTFIVSQNIEEANLLKSGFLDFDLTEGAIISHSTEESITLLEERIKNKKIPEVMVLDIDTIDINTNELVKRIRTDEDLKSMILIVLSDSNKNISKSFQFNSAGVIIRPVDEDSLEKHLGTFKNYWRLNVRPAYN